MTTNALAWSIHGCASSPWVAFGTIRATRVIPEFFRALLMSCLFTDNAVRRLILRRLPPLAFISASPLLGRLLRRNQTPSFVLKDTRVPSITRSMSRSSDETQSKYHFQHCSPQGWSSGSRFCTLPSVARTPKTSQFTQAVESGVQLQSPSRRKARVLPRDTLSTLPSHNCKLFLLARLGTRRH